MTLLRTRGLPAMVVALAILSHLAGAGEQPHILWIITDDHRPDSLGCYNEAVRGSKFSPLGFVMSPAADRLASQGTLFSQAYCNAPGCAPSRASMHTGRYSFRNGIYGFEQVHPEADFCRPTIPQVMRSAGYRTAEFGKHGYRIHKWGPGLTWTVEDQYDHRVDRKKDLEDQGRTDYFPNKPWEKGRQMGKEEVFYFPDGKVKRYYIERAKGEDLRPEDIATRRALDEELDILRARTRQSSGMIIGGQSPQPPDRTLDGEIASSMIDFLEREVDPGKPLFIHLGFHFPHTPVLAPKKFRDIFKAKSVEIPTRIPEFDPAEVDKMPAQLRRLHEVMNFSGLHRAEKIQAIRDYFAFCAHGDAQVGRAIDAFIAHSKKTSRDWIVIYVCGDHSWHLGEQGIESKFGPWAMSTHNAIIAASSIKGLFPAGSHCDDLVEFVDLAPSFYEAAGVDISGRDFAHLDGTSLAQTAGGRHQRDYIVGEINHVVGPRAYLRSKQFAFSMRTRPKNGKPGQGFQPGENIKWALECPRPMAELCLYDLRHDPGERWNLADDPRYAPLADWFRKKLGTIVLGDRRTECDWKQKNTYVITDFALGADDKALDIPAPLIPSH